MRSSHGKNRSSWRCGAHLIMRLWLPLLLWLGTARGQVDPPPVRRFVLQQPLHFRAKQINAVVPDDPVQDVKLQPVPLASQPSSQNLPEESTLIPHVLVRSKLSPLKPVTARTTESPDPAPVSMRVSTGATTYSERISVSVVPAATTEPGISTTALPNDAGEQLFRRDKLSSEEKPNAVNASLMVKSASNSSKSASTSASEVLEVAEAEDTTTEAEGEVATTEAIVPTTNPPWTITTTTTTTDETTTTTSTTTVSTTTTTTTTTTTSATTEPLLTTVVAETELEVEPTEQVISTLSDEPEKATPKAPLVQSMDYQQDMSWMSVEDESKETSTVQNRPFVQQHGDVKHLEGSSLMVLVSPRKFTDNTMIYLKLKRISPDPLNEVDDALWQESKSGMDSPSLTVTAIPMKAARQQVHLENLFEGWYLVCGEAVRRNAVLEKGCFKARVFPRESHDETNALTITILSVVGISLALLVLAVSYGVYVKIHRDRRKRFDRELQERVDRRARQERERQEREFVAFHHVYLDPDEPFQERCIM